ncbi:uncharacterized protein LOC129573946 [Sitodiplosis mosellana]|uniref:uncharacterized protein LOC129573946 n=1 Tax=Sitodiplosis mosellana TaxID=263140 RepID=UPI0024446559|nr:uncharacterized protein LOC129573946 [Sitodiplosis mosellana]
MQSFVLFAIFILALQLSFASTADTEYDDDNYIDNYDDDDYTEGPLERMDLEDEDSDVHVVGKKDELRQIIFNPRKRRQRRRKHRAAYNELSSLEFCWRKHDECESIGMNETKYELTNEEEQRFWHCNCDKEFYICLHRLNSTVSSHIGELYFNYNYRCYRHDFEIDECKEFDHHKIYTSQERCVQYQLIINSVKSAQWFDLPFYDGKPQKKPVFMVRDEDSEENELDDETIN